MRGALLWSALLPASAGVRSARGFGPARAGCPADRIGVDAPRLGDGERQQLEGDDVDHGWLCRARSVVWHPERLERAHRVGRALRRAPVALEHVRPDRVVDRRQMPVQELLGLEREGIHPGSLPQLEGGLLRGRPVAPGADDQTRSCRKATGSWSRASFRPRLRRCPDLLAVQRLQRRDRARVARGVAPRPLELRRADDDLVDELGERRVGAARDEPHLTAERALGLHRQFGAPLVRDADHDVGARRVEHRLERLHRPPAGLRGVERRPAAGVDDGRPVRQPPVGRHAAQPLGLTVNRAVHLRAVHLRAVHLRTMGLAGHD